MRDRKERRYFDSYDTEDSESMHHDVFLKDVLKFLFIVGSILIFVLWYLSPPQ